MMADKENKANKMLGSPIPEEIYWKFKEVAALRKESMQDAVLNAALLYIDADKEQKGEVQNVG